MIYDKRGLSAIIVTLILILLAIVAVGVVWVVVNNVLESGEGRVNLGSACLEVDVEPTAATSSDGITYSVTMTRSAGGDEIGGVTANIKIDVNIFLFILLSNC